MARLTPPRRPFATCTASSATRIAPPAAPLDDKAAECEERVVTQLNAPNEDREESPADRYARAQEIARAQEERRPVDTVLLSWLEGYRQTAEYRAQERLAKDFGSVEAM